MRVLVLLVSTVLILALGTVLVTSCDADGSQLHILALCVALIAGVARLTRASTARPPGADVDPSSLRFGPPDPRPQLAGSTCAHCARKVTVETDGVLCKACASPLHRECRKEHKADAHRPASGQAYR